MSLLIDHEKKMKEFENYDDWEKLEYIFRSADYLDKFHKNDRKKEIYEDYKRSLFKNGENVGKSIISPNLCIECKNVLSYDCDEITRFCENCGYVDENGEMIETMEQSEKNEYTNKDQAHDKMIHFRRLIERIRGTGKVEIPQEDYDVIEKYIKRHRLDVNQITSDRMKSILKKNKMSDYYKHIPYLIHKICGRELPTFSDSEVEKLCTMFEQIQNRGAKYLKGRKNLLNYEYSLYKLCELIDRRDALPYLRLINNVNEKYDIAWKQMTREFGWVYYKTN